MPARNAPNDSVLNISRADIYRLAEPLDSPLTISEEEFASRAVLIKSVPLAEKDFGLNTLGYTDTLEFVGQAARLRYAIRLVNAAGQKAGFSNFVLVEPASRIASSPTSLSIEVTQNAIELAWKPPVANEDRSTPPNILGYNIYRANSSTEAARILNKAPVIGTTYRDEAFEFGKNYWYFVRAVSVGAGGSPVESLESNIVSISPTDTFAPSAPTAITLASSPGSISIFFAVNPESDVAGYRIYRSTDPDIDKRSWDLLTDNLLTTNTFQDTKVEQGRTYFYFLTATDTTGNVSEPSAVVSETVQ